MDCNKDEATRAKEIAERKFLLKDVVGAKKFALKAQNLFPGLEGIPQMLSTLDVYISAENKINGEADWYGILGVDQQADEETVRKQYRKLALMLHPDKNKSVGADGAFKLISEAWTLLSDKAKRMAYDQTRNAKSHKKVSNPGVGSSATTPGMNGYNSTKSSKHSTNTKPPKGTTAQAGQPSNHAPPPTHHKPKPNTFWTVCHRCKMQYEYLRVYLNHNLLCPNCHEPFLAMETAPPPSNGSKTSAQWNFSQKRQNSSRQTTKKKAFIRGKSSSTLSNAGIDGFTGSDSRSQNNFQWSPFSGNASTAAQAATVVQQAYERVRREREEAQAATKREEAVRKKNHSSKRMGGASSMGQPNAAKKRKGTDDATAGSSERNFMNEIGVKVGGANSSGSKQVNAEAGRVGGTSKGSFTREVSQLEIQSSLMDKAKKAIFKKLDEWRSGTMPKPAVNVDGNKNEKANEGEAKSLRNSDLEHDQNNSKEPIDTNVGECTIKLVGTTGASLGSETVEAMSIDVPDSDFHDFDKDRTEKSIEENQVWAAYDGDDGMPRYYAMIHSVISADPFKMRISWLNSKTNSELGPLNWVASGFTKTCGDFRIGRYEINKSLNSFSHKVRWSKGLRGVIRIYPRKGEVWAMYRNWSSDWNESTPDEVIHKYDMVEVLEDYTEELGVTVTPLVKVAGFKAVFHRHLDHREVRRIPREEMFRFSHHVPSHLLTGQEAPNAPKGCRELDPAATPLELLQVIADVKEEETTEFDEKVKADDDTEITERSTEVTKDDILVINIEENAEETETKHLETSQVG